MSAWRRKAMALFPELLPEVDSLQREDLHIIFFELAHLAKEAHAKENDDFLRRVHGFAEWCLHHGGELWDKAAIGFYEELFVLVPWERIVPWLSPFASAQIYKTWALTSEHDRREEFTRMVKANKQTAYRTHVYSTGEIEKV